MSRLPTKIKQEECIQILAKEFSKFPDKRPFYEIPLKDMLMSSYAVFALKYPSLLRFDKDMRLDSVKSSNMKSLFDIKKVPSDTQLRDVMDQVETACFRPIFLKLFSFLQRYKTLESYEFLRVGNQPYYLLSADGSGYFRSDKIGCLDCNNYKSTEKRKTKKYGHNILAGSIVHPDKKEVIPLCPEAIVSQDGDNKNDCEQNAFKRFINDLKKEHPKLNCILSLDALYAVEPVVKLLLKHEYSFIIGVKETNANIFRQLNVGEDNGKTEHLEYSYEIGDKVKKQVIHRYRFVKNVHLKQDPESVRVNVVEFWEEINWEGKRGAESKKCHFSWITDLDVNRDTVKKIMEGGRARWKIENETFNTLKNQGYYLEHNYGHGKSFLSVNFIMMMFLAFMVDQIQQASCQYFKKAKEMRSSKANVWRHIQSIFNTITDLTWDQVYLFLAGEGKFKVSFNTS